MKNKHFQFRLPVGAIILLSLRIVGAWGNEGHEIVGAIADANLTPAAKNAITPFLPAGESLSSIATWADSIKRQRPDTKPWHFVDIPLAATTWDESHSGEDIIGRMQQFQLDVVNKSNSKAVRQQALKFLVHFYGDLHQPLHCAERNGDHGGNLVKVATYLGQAQANLNLHQVWDTSILRESLGTSSIADYADKLNRQITEVEKKQWIQGEIVDWALETHTAARDHSYAGLGDADVTIDAAYIQNNQPVVDTQLKRAGIRLAQFLNKAFDATYAGQTVTLAPSTSPVPTLLPATNTPNDAVQQHWLPDPTMTPGVVLNAAVETICTPGYAKSVRNVPAKEKDEVYRRYNMAPNQAPCPCEVDHLVSLELGGSNDVGNLWPQPYTGTWNAHQKDKLENFLHAEVCAGRMTLKEAQQEIAQNWIESYHAHGLDRQ